MVYAMEILEEREVGVWTFGSFFLGQDEIGWLREFGIVGAYRAKAHIDLRTTLAFLGFSQV